MCMYVLCHRLSLVLTVKVYWKRRECLLVGTAGLTRGEKRLSNAGMQYTDHPHSYSDTCYLKNRVKESKIKIAKRKSLKYQMNRKYSNRKIQQP